METRNASGADYERAGVRSKAPKIEVGKWGVASWLQARRTASTGSGDDSGQGACGKTEVKLCKEQTKAVEDTREAYTIVR